MSKRGTNGKKTHQDIANDQTIIAIIVVTGYRIYILAMLEANWPPLPTCLNQTNIYSWLLASNISYHLDKNNIVAQDDLAIGTQNSTALATDKGRHKHDYSPAQEATSYLDISCNTVSLLQLLVTELSLDMSRLDSHSLADLWDVMQIPVDINYYTHALI